MYGKIIQKLKRVVISRTYAQPYNFLLHKQACALLYIFEIFDVKHLRVKIVSLKSALIVKAA